VKRTGGAEKKTGFEILNDFNSPSETQRKGRIPHLAFLFFGVVYFV
jgi:hypothetical protein